MPALLEITHLRFSELSPEHLRALWAGALILGAVYCFLGYRFVRFTLGMTGFLLAGGMAAILAGFLSEGRMVYMAIAGCLGGIAGAMALFFLYKVGLFCVGALGCAVAAHMALAGRPDDWIPSAIVSTSVFGGLAALIFERGVTILASAAVGAWIVCYGTLSAVAAGQNFSWTPRATLLLLAAWLALAATGAATQFATHATDR